MSSVHTVEIILGLLVAVALLTAVAEKLRVPFPIVLVLGGLSLALIPSLPDARLDPELVFILFLPPVLYGAAWLTSWRDFRRNKRPILMLSIGLTLFTTVIVGLVAHWAIPGLTLAGGFVLGAIISPPDAASATAIAQGLRLPRRVVVILEGESLVNDAMGLVLYKFAVVAVVTGSFSMGGAVGQFFWVSLGGIAMGLGLGWIASVIQCRLSAVPAVEILFSFLTAYAVYLGAEAVHTSGVLATVAAGLYSGWLGPERLAAQTRIEARAVWDLFLFVLNGLIFILIGLQLRTVLSGLMGQRSWGELAGYALLISGTAIIVRMVWVFPAAYLPHLLRLTHPAEPRPSWKAVTVIGWTGMRGIVTLAAALAVPTVTASGDPFPQRDLIVFLSFAVIVATLVIQGLTLPVLLRRLALPEDGEAEREEREARIHAARAAIVDLERIANDEGAEKPPDSLLESFRNRYQQKVDELLRDQFEAEAKGDAQAAPMSTLPLMRWIQRLRRDGLAAERRALIELRKQGRIGDEVMHKIERELDLEESRLTP